MELVDSRGARVVLEGELFRGGEGTIHPVAGNAALLAKLYLRPVDVPKQAKLAAMTGAANDALLRIAAWPTATLHRAGHRGVVGFLMPRFDGKRSELHHLYRPGTRKEEFRQADWSFLMHAARNVAAAVATVHAAGHVVGDVNQRNFIVGGDATVKVLDCDSFQIAAAGNVFLCPVGVPEFTPPELQGRPLDGVQRTPNHDAFGLAVLIFQLLFMGRHPYAGRFLGKGEMPIERAIAEGRFAFGSGSRSRLMEPPSATVPFDSLPPRLSALFDAAFTTATRPSARQWTDALEVAKRELRQCAAEPMHKYHAALAECPWCRLERANGVYFFIGITSSRAAVFELGKWWAEVAAVSALPYEPPPRPAITAVGAPLPDGVRKQRRTAMLGKIASTLVLFAIAFAWPAAAMLAIGFVALAVVWPLPGAAERKRRIARLRETEQAWTDAYRAAETALSVEPLHRKRTELQQLKVAYETADADQKKEIAKLTQNAREAQLRQFLESFLIRSHDIPDVGPKRKATLAAWGIHTAADITVSSVAGVQGFGPTLRTRLLAWRMAIEARFVFDPKRGVPQHELDAINYRWQRRKAELEQKMRAGADELRQIERLVKDRRRTIAKDLEPAAAAWAQASADVAAANRELSFGGAAK